MEFHFRAHSVQLEPDTRDYAEEKIGGALHKVLGKGGGRIDVEVTEPSHSGGRPCVRVKVHVAIPHAASETVHVDASGLKEAIDLCANKIMRAVKRRRNKRRTKARTGEFPALAAAIDEEVGDEAVV